MAWLVLIAALHSQPRIYEARCDEIERNHVNGLDQYLFWDFADHEFEVRRCIDWRRAGVCGDLVAVRPYQLLWYEKRRLFRVTSPAYRETQTDIDPEVSNRSIFPLHERRRL